MRSQHTQLLILLLSLALFGACASDKKKPSPIATTVSQIQKNLSSLAIAYSNKDENGFFGGLDPSSDALDLVRTRTLRDFEHFNSSEIAFVLERVEAEAGRLKTVVRWKGVWVQKLNVSSIEKRGKAIFFWNDASDPKMIEVRGDSPFGVFR